MAYIIADSAEAAERVHALVPEARFTCLDKAHAVLADYPQPCRYQVYAVGWQGRVWTPDQFHGFSGGAAHD